MKKKTAFPAVFLLCFVFEQQIVFRWIVVSVVLHDLVPLSEVCYLMQPTFVFFVAALITKSVPIIRTIEMGRTMYQLGMKPAST